MHCIKTIKYDFQKNDYAGVGSGVGDGVGTGVGLGKNKKIITK